MSADFHHRGRARHAARADYRIRLRRLPVQPRSLAETRTPDQTRPGCKARLRPKMPLERASRTSEGRPPFPTDSPSSGTPLPPWRVVRDGPLGNRAPAAPYTAPYGSTPPIPFAPHAPATRATGPLAGRCLPAPHPRPDRDRHPHRAPRRRRLPGRNCRHPHSHEPPCCKQVTTYLDYGPCRPRPAAAAGP